MYDYILIYQGNETEEKPQDSLIKVKEVSGFKNSEKSICKNIFEEDFKNSLQTEDAMNPQNKRPQKQKPNTQTSKYPNTPLKSSNIQDKKLNLQNSKLNSVKNLKNSNNSTHQ